MGNQVPKHEVRDLKKIELPQWQAYELAWVVGEQYPELQPYFSVLTENDLYGETILDPKSAFVTAGHDLQSHRTTHERLHEWGIKKYGHRLKILRYIAQLASCHSYGTPLPLPKTVISFLEKHGNKKKRMSFKRMSSGNKRNSSFKVASLDSNDLPEDSLPPNATEWTIDNVQLWIETQQDATFIADFSEVLDDVIEREAIDGESLGELWKFCAVCEEDGVEDVVAKNMGIGFGKSRVLITLLRSSENAPYFSEMCFADMKHIVGEGKSNYDSRDNNNNNNISNNNNNNDNNISQSTLSSSSTRTIVTRRFDSQVEPMFNTPPANDSSFLLNNNNSNNFEHDSKNKNNDNNLNNNNNNNNNSNQDLIEKSRILEQKQIDIVMDKIESSEIWCQKFPESYRSSPSFIYEYVRPLAVASDMKEVYFMDQDSGSPMTFASFAAPEMTPHGHQQFTMHSSRSSIPPLDFTESLAFDPPNDIGKRQIKVKLVISDMLNTNWQKLSRVILSPILSMTYLRRQFGLFHTALVIGPWLLEWNNSSICRPRKPFSNTVYLSVDMASFPAEQAEEIWDLVSTEIVRWNTRFRYTNKSLSKKEQMHLFDFHNELETNNLNTNDNTNDNNNNDNNNSDNNNSDNNNSNEELNNIGIKYEGSCQDFVESLLKKLGIDLLDYEGTALGNYLKSLRNSGTFSMRFDMTSDFKTEFNINSEMFSEFRRQDSLHFQTHRQLDLFCIYLTHQMPNIQSHPRYQYDWALLKGFDRAFWMRFRKWERALPEHRRESNVDLEEFKPFVSFSESQQREVLKCPFGDPFGF